MQFRISMTIDIDEAEMESGQDASDLVDLVTDELEQFFWDYAFVGDVGTISIQVKN